MGTRIRTGSLLRYLPYLPSPPGTLESPHSPPTLPRSKGPCNWARHPRSRNVAAEKPQWAWKRMYKSDSVPLNFCLLLEVLIVLEFGVQCEEDVQRLDEVVVNRDVHYTAHDLCVFLRPTTGSAH